MSLAGSQRARIELSVVFYDKIATSRNSCQAIRTASPVAGRTGDRRVGKNHVRGRLVCGLLAIGLLGTGLRVSRRQPEASRSRCKTLPRQEGGGSNIDAQIQARGAPTVPRSELPKKLANARACPVPVRQGASVPRPQRAAARDQADQLRFLPMAQRPRRAVLLCEKNSPRPACGETPPRRRERRVPRRHRRAVPSANTLRPGLSRLFQGFERWGPPRGRISNGGHERSMAEHEGTICCLK